MRHPHLLSAWFLPALLVAQDAPRVVAVPARVELPAPGANLLLEVETTTVPDAIWLAVDRAAQDRVALVAAGERRFQLNLAAPAVADLLPAGRDHGELVVFARHGEAVVASTPIGWQRAAAGGPARLRCIVRERGAPARRLEPGASVWLDPARLEQLELEGAGQRQSTAVARLAEVDLPLARQAATGTWTLAPTAALRERMHDGAGFTVEVRVGATTEAFTFRCVPAALDLPDGAATFSMLQRARAFVPGSREWLEVRIDDITAGSVQFALVTATGTPVVPAQALRERDHVAFALGDQQYVLAVQRLVNVLVGDDHAEFVVQPAAAFRPDRIGELLRAVETSDAVFVREGKDYAGEAAAQFLRAKLAAHRGPAPTVDEFVDRVASVSSRNGEPYQVRRADGTVLPMRDWLRAELQRIDAAAAKPR